MGFALAFAVHPLAFFQPVIFPHLGASVYIFNGFFME